MPKKPGKPFKKTVVPRLKESQKLTLLALLISNQRLFDRAADKLTAEHLVAAFPETLAYAAIWRAVTEFYIEHSCIPTRELLEIRIKDVINDNVDDLSSDDADDIESFIEETYEAELPKADSAATVSWVDKTLQKLLTESLADKAARMISSGEGTLTADLPLLLDTIAQEAHKISADESELIGAPLFDTGWEEEKMVVTRTSSVDLIDRFTAGEVSGEVVIIAGPYGSCKSLLAVNSIVCAARRWSAHWHKQKHKGVKNVKRPVAVYVSYETPRAEFRRRFLSNAAKIPYTRLMKMKQLNMLRGPDEVPGKYEENMFSNGHTFVSEKERVASAVKLANDHVAFIDMTGKDPALQHYGQDGIAELQRVIRSMFKDKKDVAPVVMWVDHTAEMADEFAIAHGIDDKEKLQMLRMLPKHLSKLGSEFNMPVYQIHQLSGEANSKGATARLSVTDMEGCKSLARSADFVLLINKPTDAGHTIVSCMKHRRFKPPHKELVVRINGAFMSLRVDDQYVVDSNSRVIMPKSLLSEIHGPDKKAGGSEANKDTFSEEVQG